MFPGMGSGGKERSDAELGVSISGGKEEAPGC